MNRDAKIGVVVILIIVGVLVIVWGRGGSDKELPVPGDQAGREQRSGVVPNNINTGTDRAGSTLGGGDVRATSPGGARVVGDSGLSMPPVPGASEVAKTTAPPDPAPVKPDPPKPELKYWTYTVGDGDMLFLIAREQLGDGGRWPEIAELNKLVKPYALQVGQKLKMPPKDAAPVTTAAAETATAPAQTPAATADSTASAAPGTRKYVVKKGDGLIVIAREQLHDANKWQKIAELNHLTHNAVLKPGQVILLPE